MTPQEVLGGVVSLMRYSKVHNLWTVRDIDRLILPPILLKQYECVVDGQGHILAYASWGWLTEEKWRAFVINNELVHPEDWNAGNVLWFADLIAPFGHGKQMFRHLRDKFRHLAKAGHRGYFRRNYGSHKRFASVA